MWKCSALILGVAALVASWGCTPPTPPSAPTTKEEVHDHPDIGPHGGPLAEWGAHDYILEFTVNPESREAVVYILDGKAAAPKPISSKTVLLGLRESPAVAVTLEAKPSEGDPAGSSSRFIGKHQAFAEKKAFAGTLSCELDGKKYSGFFK